MTNVLPYPAALAPDLLLDVLSLRTNLKLRRELSEPLAKAAGQDWPSHKNEGAWARALLNLLARPDGPSLYLKAVAQHNGGPLGADHKQNLPLAACRFTLRDGRGSCARSEPEATIRALLEAGAVPQAALLAWATTLFDPARRDTVGEIVATSDDLRAVLGLPSDADAPGITTPAGGRPATEPLGTAGMLTRLRAAAATLASSEQPGIAALEALAELATDLAAALRLAEAKDARARETLVQRFATSQLDLGHVDLPQDVPLADIEDALDLAEQSARQADEAELAFREATSTPGKLSYDLVGEKMSTAMRASEAATSARAALLRLLPGSSDPEPPLKVEQPTTQPVSEMAHHDAGRAAGEAASEPSCAVGAPLAAPEPQTPQEQATLWVAPETGTANPVAVDEVTLELATIQPNAPEPVAPAEPKAPLAEVIAPGPMPEAPHTPRSSAHMPTAPVDDPTRRALLRALAERRLGLVQALLAAGAAPDRADLLGASVQLSAMGLVADEASDPDAVTHLAKAVRSAWSGARAEDAALTAWLLALPAAGLMIVLAPGSNCADLIGTLLQTPPEGLPRTLALGRALLEHAVHLSALSQVADALGSAVSEDERRRKMLAQGEALRDWLERNRDPQLGKYVPAQILWGRMIHPEEPLGRMLAAACSDAADRVSEIASELAHFDSEKEEARLDAALRSLKIVHGKPIERDARRDLDLLVKEAQELLHTWVRLARRAATPEQRGMAHALRHKLLPLIRYAAEEIGALPGEPAAPVASKVLARFDDLLAHGKWPDGPGHADQLLARDVLQVPSVPLDRSWRMSVPPAPDMLADLLAAVADPVPLDAAIRRRIAAGDLAVAVQALDLVEDDETRASLDRDARDAASARHQAMVQEMVGVRTAVEAAEGTGRLEYGLAQRFLKDIDDLELLLRLATPQDIPPIESEFASLRDGIARALENASAQQRARILRRLGDLDLTVQTTIRGEVTQLIDQGWLPNAEDLIDRAESGDHIDARGDGTTPAPDFAAFFPERSERIARALRTYRPGIIGLAEQAAPLPVDLIMLPERRETGQLLARAWVACASGRNPATAFATLFAQFGFTGARIEALSPLPGGATRMTLRCQPLRDRDTTLLPDFGSVADGNYPVVALTGKPELRQVRDALQNLGGTARASFILYFGILTNLDRRELARMAATGQLGSAIVVDHVLLAHLALGEGGWLRHLFVCTLPFSGLAPWSAIGAPAPEMFFGRNAERQGIEARTGRISHLVYGGRQLGKTALLRQIERAAAGDARRVVRYVDIKAFGTTRPTTELWHALTDALRAAVPMRPDRGGDPGARFLGDVQSWLDGGPDRSVLLLLDEADKFFREDQANGYPVTDQLRGLAERTDRRFKPVFAGLENVQRTSRDPNNPIAQLGQPLPIGPLLRREERRAAADLVRWPFEALGFVLAPAVVNRILVFANYYPSLVQLVCEWLLRELRARQSGPPPWTVEMVDVETLLARPDMRRAAFDKFRITLELDPRYDLLALAAAVRNQEEGMTLQTGVAAHRLREDAATFWPAGFAGLDEEAFDALLDQMVGLGVLRATGARRYALRSANLIHLIGSPKAIEDQLLAFLDRPASNDPDPLEHRRYIDEAPSLLTARQEAELLGLNMGDGIVVCLGLGLGGTPPGDGRGVERAARQAVLALPSQRRPAVPVLRAADAAGFRKELSALAGATGEQARLAIVTPRHGWTPDWVREAVAVVQARHHRGPSLRVIFIADADQGWQWTEVALDRAALLAAGGAERPLVTEIVPGLWNRPSIDVWMALYDQTMSLPDWLISDRITLLQATGGWHWALRRLLKLGQPSPARTDAAGLAAILLAGAGGDTEIRELAARPGLAALIATVEEAHSLRREDEVVTESLLADLLGRPLPGLAWAQAVELVVPGAHGLELNPLISAALNLLQAPTR